MHYSPKERALIVEPRCQLYSWVTGLRTFHRIEIAGEPLTCAWTTAREAWAAALRSLKTNSL